MPRGKAIEAFAEDEVTSDMTETEAVMSQEQVRALMLDIESSRGEEHDTVTSLLNQPLDRSLVKQRKGYGENKLLDYLEWFTTVRQLNRIFGYGNWSTEVLDITDKGASDHEDAQYDGVPIVVRATVRLILRGPLYCEYTNVGTCGNTPRTKKYDPEKRRMVDCAPYWTWDGYEMAVKGAVHDALKRCTTALGDQFGLSLYEKEEQTVQTQSEAVSRTETTQAPVAELNLDEGDPDAPVPCEGCGKDIKGYTNRAGKHYTTADLIAMSQKQTGGRTLCYDCKSKR